MNRQSHARSHKVNREISGLRLMLLPRETRAGTALLSIQKETQDRTTISMVGKYVCSMKKKMCLRRMKLMNRRLYQPDGKRRKDTEVQTSGINVPLADLEL